MLLRRGPGASALARASASVRDGPSKEFFEMMSTGCFELKLVEFLPSDFPRCFPVPTSPRIWGVFGFVSDVFL